LIPKKFCDTESVFGHWLSASAAPALHAKLLFMKKEQPKNVAVIGLGNMGRKLVALLQVQHELMVWNRTIAKATA
jgi:glutamyl-tRNA reductase